MQRAKQLAERLQKEKQQLMNENIRLSEDSHTQVGNNLFLCPTYDSMYFMFSGVCLRSSVRPVKVFGRGSF